MPEPLLYCKAMAAAAVVSVLVMLAAAPLRHRIGWFSRLSVLALAAGLAAGYVVLSLPVGWPPANALARWLTIVLPLVLLIELFGQAGSGVTWLPNWIAWTLRVVLALAIPRILLHQSVYLSGPEYGWSVGQATVAMLLCGTGLLVVWGLLVRLANRAALTSVLATLVLTILTAGIAIMLAGYLGGGAAALPLAACLLAVSLSHRTLLRRHPHDPAAAENTPVTENTPAANLPPAASAWLDAGGRAMLSVAVVGLFGLLFVGHFFGRLSVPNAAVLGLTPLLGWATELPGFRRRSAWTRAVLRIVLVAVPLGILLGLAKQKFDRELAPLM